MQTEPVKKQPNFKNRIHAVKVKFLGCQFYNLESTVLNHHTDNHARLTGSQTPPELFQIKVRIAPEIQSGEVSVRSKTINILIPVSHVSKGRVRTCSAI